MKTTGDGREVEVCNLAANRSHDLDDLLARWQKLQDIHAVTVDDQSFDASNRPLKISGPPEPVRLTAERTLCPGSRPEGTGNL